MSNDSNNHATQGESRWALTAGVYLVETNVAGRIYVAADSFDQAAGLVWKHGKLWDPTHRVVSVKFLGELLS